MSDTIETKTIETPTTETTTPATPETATPAVPDRNIILLPPNVRGLAKLCSPSEHMRYGATTGVQLTQTHEGYKAEATDGRVLGIITGPNAADPKDYPCLDALEQPAEDRAKVVVIEAGDWERAFKAAPKGRKIGSKPILANVAVALSYTGKHPEATLASTDLLTESVTNARGNEGRYPNMQHVIPTREPKTSVDVDPKYLVRVLEVAKSLTNEESKRVTLEFYEKENLIGVRVKNAEGQEFRGLVVPLSRGQNERKAA